MMNSKRFLLLLLMAIAMPWAAQAQSLNEGFESTTFPPEEWSTIHVSGTNQWERYTFYHYTGKASARAHWANNGHENYLITPKLAPASGQELTFYVAAQNYSGTTLKVELSTTTPTAAAFTTVLATYTTGSGGTIGTTSTNAWVAKTIPASVLADYVGQPVYIAFHVIDNGGSDVAIDDVTGVSVYVPEYPKPINVRPSTTTDATATILWDAPESTHAISGYTYNYKRSDEESWSPEGSVTATSATIEGLAATTQYDFRVKARYDNNSGESDYATASFTTNCGFYGIPYTYGFEEAEPFACWTVISGNITRKSSSQNSGSYRLDFRGTTSNVIALPQYTEPTNTLRVEFYTRPESSNSNCGKFAVGYMTDIADASTFVPVATYNYSDWGNTVTYLKKTVDFVNVPVDANIAMRQFECATNCYWYVDDVTVTEMPSCVAPSALAAEASATSAELSWNANNDEVAWTIYYKKVSEENYTGISGVEDNPYLLEGLTAASNYQFYVVANCSSDDNSEPSEVFAFTTGCEATDALGFTENFDTYTAGNGGVLPTCWSSINTCTDASYSVYPYIYANSSYNTYAHSSPNCLCLYSYYASYTDYDPQPQYAILPEMNGLANMQVTLVAKGYSDYSTFKIGTMSDPADAGTFTMIAEQELTTGYPEEPFEFNIPSACNDSYLAIMIDAANPGRISNGVYIDDIVIRETPACSKPTGLAVTANSLTSDGAVITWAAGGDETIWQIEFANDADFTNPWYETAEDQPTYTFHGLDEATTYFVHVQSVCGGSDGSSEYSSVVSFTTLQSPANLPYSNDFESENGWLLVNGTLTNAWTYGEASSNGEGTHALYISNDGGNTNTYVNGNTVVYATKLFNFEAGSYAFSYDWKARGESSYDYLRVALVPDSVQLAAATTVPTGFGSNSLPIGWIALDGGSKHNLQSGWQSFTSDEIVVTAGTYMMVFAWRNDGSSNYNPPAAIDNVSIGMFTTGCETMTVTIAGVGEDNWDDSNSGYYLIATPVVNELDPVAVGMTVGDYDLYSFDQAQEKEWCNYKEEAFDLVSGKGYLYANQNDVTLTFTGNPYEGNGEVTLVKADNADLSGWNLVGNPFGQTAYIDRDFFAMNDTGSEIVAVAGGTPIAPMQGIFVIADEEGETLTFSTTQLAMSATLALNLSQNSNVVDRAIVSFEGERSLPKLQLSESSTKVYIPMDGKDYAIVSAKSMGEMPVSFKAEKNGTYTLGFNAENVEFSYLHLIDNMTGNDVNLLTTPSYSFEARTTDYASRFRLVFATGSSTSSDTFGFVNAAGNLCIFGIEGEATLQVVDVLGHVVSSSQFSGSYEQKLNVAPGVYMLRLIHGNDVKVQKIVVK